MESSKFTMILPMSLSGRVVNKIVSETNALKSMVYLDLGNRKMGMEITVICLAHDKSVAENDCKVVERLLKSGDF